MLFKAEEAVDDIGVMRVGDVETGGTTSTNELRSEVEYRGLCLPRM